MSSNGWKNIRLENSIVEIIDGDRGVNYPRQEEFFEKEYCLFLNAGNVTKGGFNFEKTQFISKQKDALLRKGKLKRNDIVLTTRGTVGNVAYYDDSIPFDNVRINSEMVILRVDNAQREIFIQYLYHFLRSSLFGESISSHSSGSAQPQLPIKDLKQIEILLPPFETQRRIANVLSALDEKIELNRQTNATLEAIAQAIFKEWFVDFNFPLSVPRLADYRDYAAALPSGESANQENQGKDRVESAAGLIPRGWEVKPLPEAIEVNPSRALRKGDIAPYLDMANMPTQGHRGIEWVDRPFGSGTKFINGDTLLARITPCLENGKTAFVDFLAAGQTGWGSTEYIVLRPKAPLPPEYGYYLARLDTLRNHAIQNMIGTSGRQRTPASSLDTFLVVVPLEAVAKQFGEIAGSIISQIRANDEESRTLAQLRDSLLPKLMNGEIVV